MTEKEYRALSEDSYSSLKVFLDDRKKYYKKFVQGEDVEEDDSKSLTIGALVDTLVFEPHEFEGRFDLSSALVPTGQMLKFVSSLFRKTVECMSEEGEITRDMEILMEEAYRDVKFDREGKIVDFKRDSLEVVVDKFQKGDGETYYRQLRASYGKKVVSLSEMENAEKIVAELKTNRVTRDVININSSNDVDVYTQKIIIFEVKGYPLKAMIDKMVVDHRDKVIRIYDLKTCWDNENEFQRNYYKYKYYIQAAVYYLAALWWAEKEGWGSYKVEFMEFIVADSNNYQNPLRYPTNVVNLQEGLEGFKYFGRSRGGVYKAIDDLKWHREKGIWNISKDNFDSNGVCNIIPFSDDY